MYPDFATGRLNNASGREQYKKLWEKLANQLNCTGFGEKSVEKWQKTWSDYKCNLKRKAAEIKKLQQVTGGGPESEKKLTEIEKKFLSFLGETFYKGSGVVECGLHFMTSTPSSSKREEVNNVTPKRKIDEMVLEDHDYLSLPLKTPKKLKKTADPAEMYQQTIGILEDIHHTLDKRLVDITATLGKLTEAVTASINNSNTLEKLTEAVTASVNNSAAIAASLQNIYLQGRF